MTETMTKAVEDVLAERQRQQSAEGWTPEHDDQHTNMEMGYAAACYAGPVFHDQASKDANEPPIGWPWAKAWWKPTSYRRNLVKAGALILAEIERLDRRGEAQEPSNG